MRSLFLCILAVFSGANAAENKNGALVSTQMYYLGQEKYTFNIVSTDVENSISTITQELIPASVRAGDIESFTAYDEETRTFYVAAVDYPEVSQCTFWQSTISADTMSTTPVVTELTVQYPVSKSPAPLNVAHLQLSRLILANGQLYATFLTGEVHQVDLKEGSFNYMYSLISAESQLSEIHPYMTWGHVFDSSKNVMWSVAMGAADAFLMSSSFQTREVSAWIKMAMPQGDNSGFSPETIVNMHMATLTEGEAPQVMVIMESLHNLGFDEVALLDTTTGQLDCKQCNMMSDLIELSCDTNINGCDKWRVTAWDQSTMQLYYQAHSTDPDSAGDLKLVVMGFDHNKATGNLNWWTNVQTDDLWFGLSGFQFVKFV